MLWGFSGGILGSVVACRCQGGSGDRGEVADGCKLIGRAKRYADPDAPLARHTLFATSPMRESEDQKPE